jgi:hypothetical protein
VFWVRASWWAAQCWVLGTEFTDVAPWAVVAVVAVVTAAAVAVAVASAR